MNPYNFKHLPARFLLVTKATVSTAETVLSPWHWEEQTLHSILAQNAEPQCNPEEASNPMEINLSVPKVSRSQDRRKKDCHRLEETREPRSLTGTWGTDIFWWYNGKSGWSDVGPGLCWQDYLVVNTSVLVIMLCLKRDADRGRSWVKGTQEFSFILFFKVLYNPSIIAK